MIFFYLSEFETILTSLEIKRVEKKKYQLDNAEQQRIEKILQKAVDKETGKLSDNDDSLTEDNPEGREYFKSEKKFRETKFSLKNFTFEVGLTNFFSAAENIVKPTVFGISLVKCFFHETFPTNPWYDNKTP